MGPLNLSYLGTDLSLLWARLILFSPGLSYCVANLSYPPLVICPTLPWMEKAIRPLPKASLHARYLSQGGWCPWCRIELCLQNVWVSKWLELQNVSDAKCLGVKMSWFECSGTMSGWHNVWLAKCLGQSCRRLPNFGRSPEVGSFQKIAQNFCAIFKIGQKRPKKLPNATETLKKLPK